MTASDDALTNGTRAATAPATERLSRRKILFRKVLHQPLGIAAAFVLLVTALIAIFAPVIAPFDPTVGDPAALFVRPNATYWLGTDAFGRDNLSRLVWGARVSLAVGLGTSVLGVGIGALLGIVAGYFGGWLDLIVQRVMDATLAFPMLLLGLAMATILGPSLHNVIIALAIPIVPRAARVARASTLVLTSTAFIEAARAIGCSDTRIIFRHILPNAFAPLLIITTAYMGLAIVQEAALDYLGAGIQEPASSWGLMMSGSATTLALVAPWIVLFPGIAICMLVLASNLLGDAIRDVLDPKMQRNLP